MIYEKNIPDFALQPAKEAEESADDGFDPTPYDRILNATPPEDNYDFDPPPRRIEPSLEAKFEKALAEVHESKEAEEAEKLKEPASESEEIVEELEEAIEEIPEVTEETSEVTEETPEAASEIEEPMEALPVIAEPAVIPVSAPIKKEPAKVIPMAGSLIHSDLKLTDIKEQPKTRIFIEEDILVPDIKPDLASILSMDGMARLSDKEIQVGVNGEDSLRISGEIALQTIYIPDKTSDQQEPIITIQSRIPFKTDWGVSVSPLSHVAVKPIIESVEFTIINERKFRAKIALFLTLREYADLNIEIFEGIRGEEVQLLKEKIQLTDVAVRKTDVMEINESMTLKDSTPEPDKILKYNINIVENHKQITGEKAVINATIYCNILYLADQEFIQEQDGDADEEMSKTRKEPCIFQGKTEFTQFIPFDGDESPAGSRINFNGSDLSIKIKKEEGMQSAEFQLEGTVETSLELYKNIEREVVTDLYHNVKDISYEYLDVSAMALSGNGVTEASVREILNVPEKYGEVEKVIYITARIKNSTSTIEQAKNIVEGIAEINLLCISADQNRTPFKMTQEIPFRGSMEIPGIKQTMYADNDIAIKDLWFDKINSKQIEINAGIFISSTVSSQGTHHLIKNVCFVEKAESTERSPSMVIYIARKGDNLWKIAKKYRTTIDTIKTVNGLDQGGTISPGTKLLIVK